MESTLNNLQQIKDLKVISRTSAEKYRNTSLSIPEIAKELNVKYFVEGSGQKIGDRILLNIQLIEASSDRHLWGNQYRREVEDIFELQQEIAKNIAKEIEVIISPEEERRIEKNPTDDVVAYDFYLKGKDLFYKSSSESLAASIPYFRKAIEHDNKFALAYANAVMVFYYLDMFQVEKKYTAEVNSYAQKAMLYDPKSGESLIAKALSYAHKKEYELAVPYLEKALEYDPNSGLVIHFLTEFYSFYVPNAAKQLEYALKKVKLDIASQDSATASYNYLNLGNAFLQAGFTDEAMRNIDKSLAYNPKNAFGIYVKVSTLYSKNRDLKETSGLLIAELNKDTTRIDVIQEVGKFYYLMRDYKNAYRYYKRFIELRETQRIDIFKHDNLKMGIVLSKMGFDKKSEDFVKSFKDYADQDRSITKHMNLAMYYSQQGDAQKAIDHMKLFLKEDNYPYRILLFDMHDPAFDAIKHLPEFKKILRDIETKFWDRHKEISATLEKKGLLKGY